MSTNREIAESFRQIATALELLEANRFRINSYQRVARVLRDLNQEAAKLVAEQPRTAVDRLTVFDGIGKSSAQRIVEHVETGGLAEHRKLLEQVPEGLFEVLAIPGVGPKAARAMWQELGVTDVASLKARLDSPELSALPRMGVKTIDNIKQAIRFHEQSSGRVPLGIARPLALELAALLRAVPGVQRLDFAGSLRRGRETIGDLDFLAASNDPGTLRDLFLALPQVTQVLARGDTKCSVRLVAPGAGQRNKPGGTAMQADLRIVPEAVYGAALMYFTGSKAHNVRLREIAIHQKMRLNEYGLFAGNDPRPQDRGATPVAADTEEAIYAALGLPFVPPEVREEALFHSPPSGGTGLDHLPPRLIEQGDIRAELHAHTTASDGKLSIEELARCAIDRGFHTLAVTDHSKSSVIANGLDEQRLLRHIEAVREAGARISGLRLLAGSEVDILPDGRLDYDDDILSQLDAVVASPHASLRQDPKTATARLLAAIRHPLVHIIGHPTGRFVNRREGLSPDMNALFEAAAEHDVALELNANWLRLDLRDHHLRGALGRGVKIAIDTDAHRERDFDNLVYGVLTARRAGLEPASCINTWPAEKLHAWLASKR